MLCRHGGPHLPPSWKPCRGSQDLYHLTKDPASGLRFPFHVERPEGQDQFVRGAKKHTTSFIEIYLTYNELHIFKVYNVVTFWHMYIPGTHHHNQNHTHHPINFIGGVFSGGFLVEDSLEGCKSRYGH